MDVVQFEDFNFKLLVIDALMYQSERLQPRFHLRRFVENYAARSIDTEEEGFEIIPEVRDFFRQLPIPRELLAEIETLYQDGGNEIYGQLCPLWDGEDDIFDLRSINDCALLPNLKRITLMGRNLQLQGEFEARGITVENL